MKILYIGIDTGSYTGVAFWHKIDRKMELMQFTSHSEAMLYLHEKLKTVASHLVKFRIEDARLTTKYSKRIPKHLLKDNAAKIQGVGYVKAYSKDWEAFCKNGGYDYELVAPQQSVTKTSPEYFEKLTGIKTLKTQSHKRDAGMLVFGI